MGVVVGSDDGGTTFNYIEYQALMVCLAGVICLGFLGIEFVFRRFQVLPLLFPGMFSIRERKFYVFDLAVEDVAVGMKLRHEAKMVARLTIWVVLSYIWQHSVLETEQVVGTKFPKDQCDQGFDCFTAEIHYLTLMQRQHAAINCTDADQKFTKNHVITCIRFVQPTATVWLMHLAIAHSVTQLTFKSYEMLTWSAGYSAWLRRFICLLMICSLALIVLLFFSGVVSEFVSSWLSFVMALSIPVFFFTAWRTARILEYAHRETARKHQERVEAHFNSEMADAVPLDHELRHSYWGFSNRFSPSARAIEARDKLQTSLAAGARTATDILHRVLSRQRGTSSHSLQGDSSTSPAGSNPLAAPHAGGTTQPLTTLQEETATPRSSPHDGAGVGIGV